MPQHLLPLTACSLSMRPGQQAAERDRRRGWRWREMGEKGKERGRRREKGKNRQGKEPDYRRGVRARGHEEDRQRRQNVIMNQLDAELLPYLVMRLDSSSQADVLSRVRVQYQHDRSDWAELAHIFKGDVIIVVYVICSVIVSVTEYEEAAERRLGVMRAMLFFFRSCGLRFVPCYSEFVVLNWGTDRCLSVCKTFPAHMLCYVF